MSDTLWLLGLASAMATTELASGLLAAPWGVKLPHSIPPLLLKRCFAVFPRLTVLRMFWSLAT